MLSLKSLFLYSVFLLLSLSSTTVLAQSKWFKAGSSRDQYNTYIDSTIKHETKFSVTLKSKDEDISGFATLMQNMNPEKYLGKRVRMTGYLKSQEVVDWSGFWFRVDQANSTQFLAFDNMLNRAISGDTDWKKYEIVLDVPTNASNIAFGALLSKTGQIWFDDIEFEIVDNSVPVTNDPN
jgi:hypothetical protein